MPEPGVGLTLLTPKGRTEARVRERTFPAVASIRTVVVIALGVSSGRTGAGS